MVADAVGVLDAYRIPAAHVVGVSMGGALAQLLALDFADRVASLVLISTSFAVSVKRALPRSAGEFSRFLANVEVDFSDAESVIEYLVDYSRVLAGGRRPFDEVGVRALAPRDVERARNFAAAQNHGVLADDERSREPLPSIATPTLVIHGTANPMFPVEHGEALVHEIPGARLLRLGEPVTRVDRADWETIVRAILDHTGMEGARR